MLQVGHAFGVAHQHQAGHAGAGRLRLQGLGKPLPIGLGRRAAGHRQQTDGMQTQVAVLPIPCVDALLRRTDHPVTERQGLGTEAVAEQPGHDEHRRGRGAFGEAGLQVWRQRWRRRRRPAPPAA